MQYKSGERLDVKVQINTATRLYSVSVNGKNLGNNILFAPLWNRLAGLCSERVIPAGFQMRIHRRIRCMTCRMQEGKIRMLFLMSTILLAGRFKDERLTKSGRPRLQDLASLFSKIEI
jgi:hypothetical protein